MLVRENVIGFMRKVAILLLIFGAINLPCYAENAPQSAPEQNARFLGHVPDTTTAIRVAEQVWRPIYKDIDHEKPFHADLKDGVWHVSGSLPDGWVGGVAEIWIRESDGKILRTGHGR